jgi:hypothetical protein
MLCSNETETSLKISFVNPADQLEVCKKGTSVLNI